MKLRGSLFFRCVLLLFALTSTAGVYAQPGERGAAYEPSKQKAEKKPRAGALTREDRRAERKKKAEARQLAARQKKVAREIARKERLIATRGYGKLSAEAPRKTEKPSFLARTVESVAWTVRDVADYVRANPPEFDFYFTLEINGIPIYERQLNPPPKVPKPQPSFLYPRLTEIPRYRAE